MSKIGMDFGTTYSTISMITGDGTLKDSELNGEGKPTVVDSLVLKDKKGQLLVGPLARDQVGKRNTTAYRGFKMMLAEDESMWSGRNYDKEFSPAAIVMEYIGKLLEKYNISRKKEKNETIDKLVVGVPEIWFARTRTIDCRGELKRIIESLGYVRDVELVSEPAAACAYFAYNYKNITGRLYEGKILLVDYGGGTLDIALCDVRENGDRSEVKAIARAGAGWNSEGQLGKAGLAFIEEIVRIALRSQGVSEETIRQDDKFYKCTYSIEQALMAKTTDIEETFEMNALGDMEDIEDIFYSIDYHDEDYDITYGMLAQAYNTVIRDLLDEKLNDIIKYMNGKGIPYDAGQQNFKIALVGGFCNFYLTKKQIQEKFDMAVDDIRFQEMIRTVADCEKAITYGAALIANGIIGFKQVAPYSLGFAATGARQEDYLWAIRKGDDVEFGKVKMFQMNGTDMVFQGNFIPRIAFNFEEDLSYARAEPPLADYRERLRLEPGKYYKFGYSLDHSMAITLHKWIIPSIKDMNKVEGEEKVVLDDIYSLMGNLMVIGE